MKENEGLSEPECPRPILGSCKECPVYKNKTAECWKIYQGIDGTT